MSFYNIQVLPEQTGHKMTVTRFGEKRLGEIIPFGDQALKCKYAIIGVEEDIGVIANNGVGGANTLWAPFLKALVNIPYNDHSAALNIGVYAVVSWKTEALQHARTVSITELNNWVSLHDEAMLEVINTCLAHDCIPIVVGGGHNNAYPLIKALSQKLGKPIDVVNFDQHADLRALEGRHSGNSFSYAIDEGYLAKYGIWGLNKYTNNQTIIDKVSSMANVTGAYYQDLRLEPQLMDVFKRFISPMETVIGLEIDCDSIDGFNSSAAAVDSWTIKEMNHFIQALRAEKQLHYINLTEAAMQLDDGRIDPMIGRKVLSVLIKCIE